MVVSRIFCKRRSCLLSSGRNFLPFLCPGQLDDLAGCGSRPYRIGCAIASSMKTVAASANLPERRSWPTLRNLAISLLRLAGAAHIAPARATGSAPCASSVWP